MTAHPSTPSGLLVRPAAERFHTRLDWLDSWHTFSFASHADPAWMGFGPLRVINDDTIAPGRGFGMHPHRDMEIVTVMVEGELTHRDSMGHSAVLRAGEVQRMGAGSGIVHSEFNASDQPCRLLQIWIEPAAAGLPPVYEQKPFPLAAEWTPLIDPDAAGGAMAIRRSVRVWRARTGAGQSLSLPELPGPRGWLQVIAGAVTLSLEEEGRELPLAGGDGLGVLAPPAGPTITAVTAGPAGADLLWFALA